METFTCRICGGVFEKMCSDEVAMADSPLALGFPLEECVVVCSACHEGAMQWWMQQKKN